MDGQGKPVIRKFVPTDAQLAEVRNWIERNRQDWDRCFGAGGRNRWKETLEDYACNLYQIERKELDR